MNPLSQEEALAELGVSVETGEKLAAYVALLEKWNRKINLVGAKTLDDPWRRHILDSAQLRAYLPSGTRRLVDLGSGAGLPGLILAILGVPEVHLIESDGRKCAFLLEASRVTATKVTVHAQRIEAVVPFAADVVTSRALASLDTLLGFSAPFLEGHSMCLFLKGARWAEELTEARKNWHMSVSEHMSLTHPEAGILQLESVRRD